MRGKGNKTRTVHIAGAVDDALANWLHLRPATPSAGSGLDSERMQKLEAELADLRIKYPVEGQAAPKRRGRRPKAAQLQEDLGQGME